MKIIRIFISSVQKEFAQERAALHDYLQGDPLFRRFYYVFLFEDVPPRIEERMKSIRMKWNSAISTLGYLVVIMVSKMPMAYRQRIVNLISQVNYPDPVLSLLKKVLQGVTPRWQL